MRMAQPARENTQGREDAEACKDTQVQQARQIEDSVGAAR